MTIHRACGATVVAAALFAPAAAQTINIDFGFPGTAPPFGYRAAGHAGAWNSFTATESGTNYPLFDVYGQLTGATVSQIGGTEIVVAPLLGLGDPTGYDRILLQDAIVTHTTVETCLFFHDLQNGFYEVTSYAWMPTSPSTPNNVHVDTNPTFFLVGAPWGGQHEELVTYARHVVQVTSGFIGPHSGVPSGGDYLTGAALNGIQLRRLTSIPPLYASATEFEWLSALGAVRYDVVRGDLEALLATGGDFTAATDDCAAENSSAAAIDHTADVPLVGSGYWYVVRGVSATGNLTYDEPGTSQVGLRDAEINASPVSCN